MLSQMAIETICSVTYVEEYVDCTENMPDDLQRYITQMREYDVKYQEILQDVDQRIANIGELDEVGRKRSLVHIQRSLIRTQEIGDEKLQLVQFILDMIDNKSRQLEQDRKNLALSTTPSVHDIRLNTSTTVGVFAKTRGKTKRITPPDCHLLNQNSIFINHQHGRRLNQNLMDFGKDQEITEPPKTEPLPERSSKRARRQRSDNLREEMLHEKQEEKIGNVKKSKKKKRKSKAEKEREDSPVDQPIDPDEPTYCLCEQVSFGEMICCDNEQCAIEWFHFACVALNTKPKGKWYCPKCRGEKATVMKSRV